MAIAYRGQAATYLSTFTSTLIVPKITAPLLSLAETQWPIRGSIGKEKQDLRKQQRQDLQL